MKRLIPLIIGSPRNVTLDWLRGLSALAVFSGHLRAALLVDFSSLATSNIFHKLFYLITGLGHQAVIIFFALSGYLVGGSIIRSLKNTSTISIKKYSITRITRLWTVLIPSLFFTLLADRLLALISPQTLSGHYRDIWNSGPTTDAYSATIKTFICNLLFLQNIASPVYGTNGTLWSLANEFWYYAIFPCMAILIFKKSPIVKRVISLVMLIGMSISLPPSLLQYFSLWFLGAVAAFVFIYYPTPICARYSYIGLISSWTLLVAMIIFSKLSILGWSSFNYDALVAAATSILVLVSSNVTIPPAKRVKVKLGHLALALSETSYSLYLFHFPAVILVAAAFFPRQFQPTPVGMLWYVLTLLLIWMFCGCMWFVFERNTNLIRNNFREYLR